MDRLFTSDPREDVRWPVRCRELEGPSFSGEIQDISPSGAFVRVGATGAVSIGDAIELVFAANELGPVVARGTIRWVGFNRAHGCEGFGVQFSDVNPILSAYVHRPKGAELAFPEAAQVALH